ncbi:hypothetical protein [Mesorhizobium sp. KR9-304]|uniref:hypothetical protein n=1 Tax=Mesorhizobium sp. KR9-304 TaxID=3156614 RepID=UPI0032B345DB
MSAPRLRLALFVVIAGFMIGGPVAEQIFGLRSKAIRSWIMFSVPGLGMVDVSFSIRQPDGTFAPLDRFALLDEPRTGKLKRIEKRKDLAEVIERICAAAGPQADIRVKARQAVRSGWRTLHTGARNACAE